MSKQAAAIHAIAKVSPELAMLGAIVERAVIDARAGDTSARVWLQGMECLQILIRIAPDNTNPQCLQQRLLNHIEADQEPAI